MFASRADAYLDPQNVDKGFAETDGFLIGGQTRASSSLLQSRSEKMTSRTVGSMRRKKQVDGQSYIFNEDMRRIRRAEEVILRAEAKFGALSRDPSGRLVPILQVFVVFSQGLPGTVD